MWKKYYMALAVILAQATMLTACGTEDRTADSEGVSDQTVSSEETSDQSETASDDSEGSGDYSVCTSIPADEVEAFAEKAKQALLDDDWKTIADMAECPIDIAGTTYEYNEDIADADITLDDDFKDALDKGTCRNMFANDEGIMLANGEVWISELLDEDGNSLGLKITAINDGSETNSTADGDEVSDISSENTAMSKHCYDGILCALDNGDGDVSPVLLGDINESDCMKDHYFMLADLNGDDLDELIVNQDTGKTLGDYFVFAYASDSKEAYCMSEKENGYAEAPQAWSDNEDNAVLFSYDSCVALEKEYSVYFANKMYDLASGEDGVDLAAEFIQTSLKDGSCEDFINRCGDTISFSSETDDPEVEYVGNKDGQQIMSCSMSEGGFVDYSAKADGISFFGIQLGDSYDDAVSKVNSLGFSVLAGDEGGRYFYNGTAYDSYCVCIDEENGKVADLDVCSGYKYAN